MVVVKVGARVEDDVIVVETPVDVLTLTELELELELDVSVATTVVVDSVVSEVLVSVVVVWAATAATKTE